MQNLKRKGWSYAVLIIWCVAAAAVQLSILKHSPIVQASGENTLNAAEEAYCQLPDVRNEKYFATLENDALVFVLTAGKNRWLCKRMVRQHNRDFALAAFWVFGPPALVLLAVWFPPFSRKRP